MTQYKGFFIEFYSIPEQDRHIWKIYEDKGKQLHAWFFNAETHSLNQCIEAIEKDEDYQFYLAKKTGVVKTNIKFESFSFIILDLADPMADEPVPMISELMDAYNEGLIAHDDTEYVCYVSEKHRLENKIMTVRAYELPSYNILRRIAEKSIRELFLSAPQ